MFCLIHLLTSEHLGLGPEPFVGLSDARFPNSRTHAKVGDSWAEAGARKGLAFWRSKLMITNIRWLRSPIRDAGKKSSAFRSKSTSELSLRVSTLLWSIYALHCPRPRGQSMMRNAPRYTFRRTLDRWLLSRASDSFTSRDVRRSFRSESWVT